MAELLKNLYSEKLIKSLSRLVKKQYPTFNSRQFNQQVLDENWQSRELKQRMRHVSLCLGEFLPSDFRKAISILIPVSDNFSGLRAYVV